MRVNGLFGWIAANDRQSLLLFGGFMAVLQIVAPFLLFIPLAAMDEAHTPFVSWSGYVARWVPLIAVAAAVAFGLQLLWHVNTIRRLLPFEFVDHADERRLCDIVEQLAIAMGLPAPYVGVLESPARNAFACGFRRKGAVIVVTRGLIDGLDDEELAAVIAHELAHIANGDIRLVAAANVCLAMLRRIIVPEPAKRPHRLAELLAFPLFIVLMPPLFLAILVVAGVSQTAVRGAHLVRALIASTREFAADARAVEVTQNPAALVSALRRIDGRSALPTLAREQDAMMIDGESSGAHANHPTIERRIAAIVTHTGAMALIAPSRRDTRAPEQRRNSGFGQRFTTIAGAGAGAGAPPAPSRLLLADAGNGRNMLGLTRMNTAGAILALVAFLAIRGIETRDPLTGFTDLHPGPAAGYAVVLGRYVTCSTGPFRGVNCAPGDIDRAIERYDKMGFPLFTIFGRRWSAVHDRAAIRQDTPRR